MSHEVLSILHALGEQLRARLAELPEYRALIVIDRTILDLAQILNEPMTAPVAHAAPPVKPAESPTSYSAAVAPAPQRVEMTPPLAVSSQGRMATAIAETIAARTASLNASAATASRFSQALSAAS
jgi:hypothetical protein